VETFWYRLTQIHLENGHQNGERNSLLQSCCDDECIVSETAVLAFDLQTLITMFINYYALQQAELVGSEAEHSKEQTKIDGEHETDCSVSS